MFKNPNVQKALKIATIGGSSIITIGAAYQIVTNVTKGASAKDYLMPAITLLVGLSAFTYAMSTEPVVAGKPPVASEPAK